MRPRVIVAGTAFTSTIGVDAVRTTAAPSTASCSTTTPSTTIARLPMKQPSSMIPGLACTGSRTPPSPTPPDKWQSRPTCAQLPPVAHVSTIVPLRRAPMFVYEGISTTPGSRNAP